MPLDLIQSNTQTGVVAVLMFLFEGYVTFIPIGFGNGNTRTLVLRKVK